jgi:anaerobic ribonucleoside-triphosphate reductase activating protein
MKFRMAGIKKHSVVDGVGVRLVIFFQGCPHHCMECHNPDTWDPDGGDESDTDEIIEIIKNTRYIDGITLSGGDPLFQPEAALEIAKASKAMGLSVWCYSGWTYDKVAADEKRSAVMKYVDVLVDGPFVISLKSQDVIYRGSSNQRLVDVRSSLESGTVRVITEESKN